MSYDEDDDLFDDVTGFLSNPDWLTPSLDVLLHGTCFQKVLLVVCWLSIIIFTYFVMFPILDFLFVL